MLKRAYMRFKRGLNKLHQAIQRLGSIQGNAREKSGRMW